MFAWMAFVYFVVFAHPHLDAGHAAYWLMMQIAMAVGLATTYPAQVWLVRRGVKQTMGRPLLAAARAGKHVVREGRPVGSDMTASRPRSIG